MTTMPFANHPDPMRAPQFYASVPSKRLIAWVIDSAIILLIAALIVPFTAFLAILIWPLLYLMVGFAYRVLTIAAGSATWGMRIMSIELRDARGERFDFSQALLHTIGYSISMAFFLIQFISIILMAGSARGQSLTDLALGSVMINRR
ncbi:MAG: RDD family protein [Pseudomonadota bacterium]